MVFNIFMHFLLRNRATLLYTVVISLIWIMEIIISQNLTSGGAMTIINYARGLLATIVFTCLPFQRKLIKSWLKNIMNI